MDQVLGRSSLDVLAKPIPGGTSLSTHEREKIDLSDRNPGWGSDLDPSVRPGVPRDKALGLGAELLYPDIPLQVAKRKIFKSTEHAKLPPVFGDSCPPRGLSGVLRDVAFRYSEGRMPHWMLLLLADRVDMVEEIFVDLAHLRVPNFPKEMGIGAEWKYNRPAFIRRTALVGLGTAAIYGVMRYRRSRHQESFQV